MKQRPKKPVTIQPPLMKYIPVRGTDKERTTKLVSLWRRDQDRSCYTPHQGKREKERRRRKLGI